LAVATETAVSRFPGNTAEKKERVIRITVEDNGPGISPSLQSRIFDPFFTTKGAGQGTGLGLSVCHGIVQEHGGHIWVESEPGQGAIFYIELPLIEVAETVSPQPVKKETAVVPDLKQRILIADDERSVREVMQRALQRQGYQVDAVATGSEALAAVRAAEYDLILCDIRMPGLNGMELYRRVKEEFPPMAGRFIFSTGDTVSASTNAFLEEIDLPCLTKPFELPELFAVVQAAFQEETAPSSA
jgi:two-component system NtrC family sensor kinase